MSSSPLRLPLRRLAPLSAESPGGKPLFSHQSSALWDIITSRNCRPRPWTSCPGHGELLSYDDDAVLRTELLQGALNQEVIMITRKRVYEIVQVAAPGDAASRSFDLTILTLIVLNV